MRANSRNVAAAILIGVLLVAPSTVPVAAAAGDDPAPTPTASAEAENEQVKAARAALAPFLDLAPDAPVRDILLSALAQRGAPTAAARGFTYTPPEHGDDPLGDALIAYGRVLGMDTHPEFRAAVNAARGLPPGLQENVALIVFAVADAETLHMGGATRVEVAEMREATGLSNRELAALIVASAIDQARPGLEAWGALLREIQTARGLAPGETPLKAALGITAGDDPLARAVALAGSPIPLEDLVALVESVDTDFVTELQLLYLLLDVQMTPDLEQAVRERVALLPPGVEEALGRLLWAETRASLLREAVFVEAAARAAESPAPGVDFGAVMASPRPPVDQVSAALAAPTFTEDEVGRLGFASGLVVAATEFAQNALDPVTRPQRASHQNAACTPVVLRNATLSLCDDHNDVLFKDPLNLVIVGGTRSTTYNESYAIPALVENLRVSVDRRELHNGTESGLNDTGSLVNNPGFCTIVVPCLSPTVLSLYSNPVLAPTEGVDLGVTRVNTTQDLGNGTESPRVLSHITYQVLTLDLGGSDVYLNNAGGANPLVFSSYRIDPQLGQNLSLVSGFCNSILPGCNLTERMNLTLVNASGTNVSLYDLGVRVNFSSIPNPLPIAAVALDLGANDTYRSTGNWTQGAATLGGIGILVDAGLMGGGNDRFEAATNSTAAATDAGFALLANLDAGDDDYIGDVNVQAVTGSFRMAGTPQRVEGDECLHRGYYASSTRDLDGTLAFLIDSQGNDEYSARCMAQAMASGGLALLWDLAGNDQYRARFHAQAFAMPRFAVVSLAMVPPPPPPGPFMALLLDEGGLDTYNLTDAYEDAYLGGLYPRGQGAVRAPAAVNGTAYPSSTSATSLLGAALLVDRNGDARDLHPNETARNTYYGEAVQLRSWTHAGGNAGAFVLSTTEDLNEFLGSDGMIFEVHDLRALSNHTKPDWAILGIGGQEDSRYDINYTLLIDLGGGDIYRNNAGAIYPATGQPEDPVMTSEGPTSASPEPGRVTTPRSSGQFSTIPTQFGETVSLLLDIGQPLGENNPSVAAFNRDRYVASKQVTSAYTLAQGAAGPNGLAFLVDAWGDDEYTALNFSQGVGIAGGIGLLVDYGGNDRYQALNKTQGLSQSYLSNATRSGDLDIEPDPSALVVSDRTVRGPTIGLLFDGNGTDTYTAAAFSQAASIGGVALLVDLTEKDPAGRDWVANDTYTLTGSTWPTLDAADPRRLHRGAGQAFAIRQEPNSNPTAILYDQSGNDTFAAGSTYSHGIVLQSSFSLGGATGAGADPGLAIFASDGDDPDVFFPEFAEYTVSSLRRWSGEKADNTYWSPNLAFRGDEYQAFTRNLVSLGLDNVTKSLNRFAVDVAFNYPTGDTSTPVDPTTVTRPAGDSAAPTVEVLVEPVDALDASGALTGRVRLVANVYYAASPGSAPVDGGKVTFFVTNASSARRYAVAEATVSAGRAAVEWNTTSNRDLANTSYDWLLASDGAVTVGAEALVPALSDATEGRGGAGQPRSYVMGADDVSIVVENGPVVVDAALPAFNPLSGPRFTSPMSFLFSEPVSGTPVVKVTNATGAHVTLSPVTVVGSKRVVATSSWDGRIDGVRMPNGTYNVSVTAVDAGGRSVESKAGKIVIDVNAPTATTSIPIHQYLNLTNTPVPVSSRDPDVRAYAFPIAGSDEGPSGLNVVTATISGFRGDEQAPVVERGIGGSAGSVSFNAENGFNYTITIVAYDKAGNPSPPLVRYVEADFTPPETVAYLGTDRIGDRVFPIELRDAPGTSDTVAWRVQYQRAGGNTWLPVPIPNQNASVTVVNLSMPEGVNRVLPFNTSRISPALAENETLRFRSLAMDRAGNWEVEENVDSFAPVDPNAPRITNLTVVPGLKDLVVAWETDRTTVQSRLLLDVPNADGTVTVREVVSNRSDKMHRLAIEGLAPDTAYRFNVSSVTYQGLSTVGSGLGKTLPSLGVTLVDPAEGDEPTVLTGLAAIRWRTGAVPFRDGGDPQVEYAIAVQVNGEPWQTVASGSYVEGKDIATGTVREFPSFRVDRYPDTRDASIRVTVKNRFQENVSIAKVILDHTPPETTLKVDGARNASGWYTSIPYLLLDATDKASGIEAIYYTLNGANHTFVKSDPPSIPQGIHNVTYVAVDRAGIWSVTKALQVKVDTRAPTVEARAEGAEAATSARDIIISVTGSDPEGGAGLDAARLRDTYSPPGEWIPFRRSDVLRLEWTLRGEAGSRVVTAEVRDKAGNVGSASLDLTLDTQAPRLAGSPVVQDATFTTIRITWSTTEPSLTRVLYAAGEPDDVFASVDEGNVFETPGSRLDHEAVLTGLIPGETYHFRIGTEDDLGNVAEWSSTTYVFTTVDDEVHPGSVSGLFVESLGDGSVRLSWAPAEDNVGVARYLIERAPPGLSMFSEIAVTTALTYRDATTLPGYDYRYRVLAVDTAGNRGDPSEETPVRVATDPVLFGGSVTPDIGHADGTVFTFVVYYTDADASPGASVYLILNGQEIPMVDNGPLSGPDGSRRFTYESKLAETGLASGVHTYAFSATDGTANARFPATGVLTGPVVQNPGFAEPADGVNAFGFGWRGVAMGGGVFLFLAAVAIAAILRWRRSE